MTESPASTHADSHEVHAEKLEILGNLRAHLLYSAVFMTSVAACLGALFACFRSYTASGTVGIVILLAASAWCMWQRSQTTKLALKVIEQAEADTPQSNKETS